MRKWIIVVFVALVLLVGVIGFAASRLDGWITAHREEIAARVGTAIGRTVAFDDVGLSLRHGLGIRIDELRVADDPAFASTDFVSVGRVDVRVKLLPLLSRRVAVSRVLLDRPVVNVVRSDRGLNLSSLGGGAAPAGGGATPSVDARSRVAAQRDEQSGSGGERAAPAATALVVALLDIRDGRVNYVDTTVSPPSRVAVEHLDVEASDIDPLQPTVFELTAAVMGSDQRNIKISGSIGPLAAADFDRTPLDLTLRIDRATLAEFARIPGLATALPAELRMDGAAALKAKVSGTVAEPRLIAGIDARDAAVRYGDRFTKPAGVPLEVEVNAVQRGREVHIDKARVTLDKSEVDVGGIVTTDAKETTYELAVNTEPISLAGWDKMFPSVVGTTLVGSVDVDLRISGKLDAAGLPQLTGRLAFSDVGLRRGGIPTVQGLTTRATLQGHSLVLAPAQFTLGGSPVSFTADVKDVSTPLAHFTFSSPVLTLAGLGVGDAATKTPEILKGLEVEGTLTTAKGPELDATLRSSAGSVRDVAYSDLSGHLRYTGGRARLDPMSVQAFGGRFEGTAVYEPGGQGKEPKFTMHGKVRDVRLPQVFDYAGVPAGDRLLDGLFDADLEIAGAGSAWQAIEQALTGTGSIKIRDGKLKRINIAEAVLGAVTSTPGLADLLSPALRAKHPALFGTAGTRFRDFRGAIRIVDGVIRADDILVNAADYALSGSGGYGFDRSVDLAAKFVASHQLSADLISEVKAMKYLTNDAGRIQIPFRLSGVGPNVKVTPDGRFIANALQRAAAGAVGDLLGGILGAKPGTAPSGAQPGAQVPPAQNGQPAESGKKKKLGLKDLLGGFGIPVP